MTKPMTLKRDPSKALQFGFVALLLLSTVQVGYWIYDHVRNERAIEARIQALYESDADAATAIFSGATPQEIAALLPHVDMSGPRARVRAEAIDFETPNLGAWLRMIYEEDDA